MEVNEKEKATMDAGVKYGLDLVRQLPKDDPLALEAHMTGVLVAFMGAMWGTFGTEYARGFIEAQLRSMERDVPKEIFTARRVQ